MPDPPLLPTVETWRAADELYKPIQPFSEWRELSFDQDAWDIVVQELANERAAASEDTAQEAIRVATRAAATDTGALEGLYQVDRGFTFAVATEAAAWQTAVNEKGIEAASLFRAQLQTYELLMDLAVSLTAALQDELTLQMGGLNLPPGASATIEPVSGSAMNAPDGYRTIVQTPAFIRLLLRSTPPAAGSIEYVIQVFVNMDKNDVNAFGVIGTHYHEAFVPLADIYQEPSAVLKLRLSTWVEGLVRGALSELAVQAEESLRRAGYR